MMEKLKIIFRAALLTILAVSSNSFAMTESNATFTAFPPSNVESASPLVMITMSRDHQYFFKAYNDYTDLDPQNNDGEETTYKHSFEYYGYFNPDKCYSYDGTDERFKPTADVDASGYCSGRWSGNFMNWATMSRMDVFRKIFYGGKRQIDTDSLTVLERAFLPTDAHSFAKYYNGPDLSQLTPFSGISVEGDGTDDNGIDDLTEGITICNTTYSNDVSQDATDPPLMRVVEGNFQLWASNERWQCTWAEERGANINANSADGLTGIPTSITIDIDYNNDGDTNDPGEQNVVVDVRSGINAYSTDPTHADALPNAAGRDHIVRVEVCSGSGAATGANNENCQAYPDGNYKPVGLLHVYGEQGLINFGLMTGSYSNNTRGGVLRKNISNFADEVNTTTDGTFNGTNGLVSTIDLLRIYGYSPPNNGVYFGGSSGDSCNFQLTDIVNGNCNSWGNPISEVYKESVRYIAGESPTANFNANDNGFIAGLQQVTWDDPIEEANQCAPLSNIVVNASVSSYDSDEIDISDLNGSPNVTALTNQVGGFEGITGNPYFVGQVVGSDENGLCTSKTVTGLAAVRGICPEGPTVDGSFAMAGMAYNARNSDLRPSLDGDQTLTTYGITLATNTPIIRVPIGDVGAAQSITILPAYRLQVGDEGGGALVDFKVVEGHTEVSSGIYTGKYYINWEDSEQGGDFDMDVWGTLTYLLDTTANEITVETIATAQSTVNPQLFGFIINGTTQDGFHAYSGILGANYTDSTGVPGCNNCQSVFSGFNGNQSGNGQKGPRSHTFDLDLTQVASNLELPLYYAAKYGSFEDPGADGPDSDNEWDATNNFTGTLGSDGLPDNYFFVNDPAQLERALGNSLQRILATSSSSGTAPANLANADGSGGLIVQAIYFDNQENDTTGESVNWTGELHAFFVDQYGFFREDNPTAGTRFELDDSPAVDKIFSYQYDGATDQLLINRFELQNNSLPYDPTSNPLVPDGAGVPASELNTIWSANEILSSLDNDDIDEQRDYGTVVGTSGASRHIITWFDKDRDGVVDSNEQIDFVAANTTENDSSGVDFARYFGFQNDEVNQANAMVNFIRGQDGIAGTRSRAITETVGGTDTVVVKRLGDIVNSTPLIVGPPNQRYDLAFGDESYQQFRTQYADRRQVMYIGGNDGLLHAFNVGYRQFSANSALSFSKTNPRDASDAEHPLGAELWAYAPFNLLPHLRWLADPLYSHVFYIDGEPTSFDVNIFDDDADHPGGWGTILVVGMRLGGGKITLDLDSNPSNDLADGCQDLCTRSSYVVLDITNPEKPPTVIAEISDELLEHTVGVPTLVKKRAPGPGNDWFNPSVNEWELIFGSGPQSRIDLDTTADAQLYRVDLDDLSVTREALEVAGNPVQRTFVGNFASADWDEDYQDDVVYFGTMGKDGTGTGDDHNGGLFRYRVAQEDSNLFFDSDRPVSSTPLTRLREGRKFVYFGSGRYLAEVDSETDEQEYFYGIMEPTNDTYADTVTGGILDTTDVEVDEDGNITNVPVGLPASVDTFSELQQEIIADNTINGWQRELEAIVGQPSERITSKPVGVRSQIFFTTFSPDENICAADSGSSRLFVLDLITGTPTDFGGLGYDGGIAVDSVDLGQGRASFPIVLTASGLGSNKGRAIIQLDTGEIVNQEVTLGKPENLERLNWREIINREL